MYESGKDGETGGKKNVCKRERWNVRPEKAMKVKRERGMMLALRSEKDKDGEEERRKTRKEKRTDSTGNMTRLL